MMLTPQQRYLAQMGLEDAHRVERYLTAIADQSRRYGLVVAVTATIGALAAAFFAGQAAAAPWNWVGAAVGIGASIASSMGAIFDFTARATRAAALAKESAALAVEWRALVMSADAADATALQELGRRQKEIEAPVSSDLPYKRRLNVRAEKDARRRVLHEIHQGKEFEQREKQAATA